MKDKRKVVPPFTSSPKEIILALLIYPKFLKILQGTENESDKLLDWLIANAWACYASIYNGLDILPRIGEYFYFAFFRAVNGGSFFQVYNIFHRYQKD